MLAALNTMPVNIEWQARMAELLDTPHDFFAEAGVDEHDSFEHAFVAFLEQQKGKKEPARAYSLCSAPHERYLAVTVKEEPSPAPGAPPSPGASPSPSPEAPKKEGRVVAVGDSDFASNATIALWRSCCARFFAVV